MGTDADARRRLGHDAGVRARAGGERGLGTGSTSTSRPSTCATATTQSDSYTYAWSELGFRPAEWLRVGVAGQRTRIYGGDRDIQRGPFAQIDRGDHVTIGGYWFNPGSSDQVFVGLIAVTF